jgi:hypothetical protein
MLNGPLPADLFEQQIQWVDFSHNLLGGTIPSSVWKSQSLIRMDLGHNILSGELPAENPHLAYPRSLQTISLKCNALGPVLHNVMFNFDYLDVSHNLFQSELRPYSATSFFPRVLNISHNNFYIDQISSAHNWFYKSEQIDLSYNSEVAAVASKGYGLFHQLHPALQVLILVSSFQFSIVEIDSDLYNS